MAPKAPVKSKSLATMARALDTKKKEAPRAPLSLKDVVRARVAPVAVAADPRALAAKSDPHADMRARLQQLAGASRMVKGGSVSAAIGPSPVAKVVRSTSPRVAPRSGPVPKTVMPSAPRQLAKGTAPTKQAPADARRKYPRADLEVQAKLALSDDPKRFFEASLSTSNISVGGMFLKSSFFLKIGTRLSVELRLPPKGRVVRVKGVVVRTESGDDGNSGFALSFTEYLDGSEVVLATHFLSPVLREFITQYAKAHHFEADPEYLAHTADVLAAWELKRAELGSDVWTLG